MVKEISISFHGEFWLIKFKHEDAIEIYAFDIDKKEYRFIAEFLDKILKEKVKADEEAEKDDYLEIKTK